MADKKLDIEYLRQQLKTSNGHFAEIVLRTYYFIVQKCRENNRDWCFNKEIRYRELQKFTYKNIGYSASLMVVKNAKNGLIASGYLSWINVDGELAIHIEKPLDFIEGDIENYI
ncbi:MAG: hypothetical protein K2O81_00015 [Clostridia bacterium]|nr:hypothetical protein [Clostridia bacterium]